jgi:dihydroxy-acid dehydratase
MGRVASRWIGDGFCRAGGVPAVLKLLLGKGLIHGDCMTVTGKTLAENLAGLPGLKEGQEV